MKYIFFNFVALFSLFSCQMKHTIAPTQPGELTAAAEEPEILFLHLKVWKKEGGYAAEMQTKQQVAGLLDRDLRGVQLIEGQWLVSFLDDKQHMVAQVSIANPLEEHYETTDDHGQLRGIDIKKQEADCFVRVQYSPRFSSLQIEQIGASQQRTKIISVIF